MEGDYCLWSVNLKTVFLPYQACSDRPGFARHAVQTSEQPIPLRLERRFNRYNHRPLVWMPNLIETLANCFFSFTSRSLPTSRTRLRPLLNLLLPMTTPRILKSSKMPKPKSPTKKNTSTLSETSSCTISVLEQLRKNFNGLMRTTTSSP